MTDFFLFLNKHIPIQQKPELLLPIMALVYLLFEGRNLVLFLIRREYQMNHLQEQEQLQSLLLTQYFRRVFLFFLAAIVSWALFFCYII